MLLNVEIFCRITLHARLIEIRELMLNKDIYPIMKMNVTLVKLYLCMSVCSPQCSQYRWIVDVCQWSW
jgi:hypothetical protein